MYDNAPPHPGEIIRDDIFPALAMTKTDFARRLGISVHRLNNLLAERQPVTLDLALRLGTVVGYGPRYWLGVQIQHDIWRAEQEQPVRLKPIVWRRAKTRVNVAPTLTNVYASAAM